MPGQGDQLVAEHKRFIIQIIVTRIGRIRSVLRLAVMIQLITANHGKYGSDAIKINRIDCFLYKIIFLDLGNAFGQFVTLEQIFQKILHSLQNHEVTATVDNDFIADAGNHIAGARADILQRRVGLHAAGTPQHDLKILIIHILTVHIRAFQQSDPGCGFNHGLKLRDFFFHQRRKIAGYHNFIIRKLNLIFPQPIGWCIILAEQAGAGAQ